MSKSSTKDKLADPKPNLSLKETETVFEVMQFLRQVEDSTREMRDVLIRCRKNYAGKFDDETTNYTKRPKIFYPITAEKIDGISPKLVVNPTALVVQPQEEADIMKARLNQEILKFEARRNRIFERFNNEELKNLLIDGTLVAKVRWAYKAQGEKVTRDAAEVDYVDLLDFYIDPLSKGINHPDTYCVAHKVIRSLQEVQNNPDYKNTKYLSGFLRKSQGQSDGSATMSYELETQSVDVNVPKVAVIEYWTNDRVVTLALDNDDIGLASDAIVLRDIENPFEHGLKPFVECWYDKPKGRWYGRGVAERLLSLQNWSNAVVNLRVDNLLMILNKMFLKRRGANIDIRQLISRPAGFIEVDDISTDIKPLEYSDSTRGALEELAQINTVADRLLSSFELVRGGGNPKTASEAIIQNETAKGFFELKLSHIREFFVKMFDQIHSLNMQYFDEETTIRITGNKNDLQVYNELLGVPAGQEGKLPNVRFVALKDMGILGGDYDIEIDIDLTGTSRSLKVRQLQDVLALAQQDPTAPVNKENIYRQLFYLLFGDDSDLYIKEVTPEDQMMMQQKLLGGAAQAQGFQGTASGNALAYQNQTELGAQQEELGGVKDQLAAQLGQSP